MNNYIFFRLLATLDLSRNHELIITIFKLGGYKKELSKSIIRSWRTHDQSNRHFRSMPDVMIKIFFDGLQQASKQNLVTFYFHDNNQFV